ncbi:MAG: hypothetical protein AAGE52_21525 [Myxococcota bacterium]
MKAQTIHETLDVPAEEVFGYLADVANLPAWAIPFCRRLEETDGQLFVHSPEGRLAFALSAEPKTQTVCLRFGREHSGLATYPMVVVALPGGRSLVAFTGWQLPGVSDAEFDGQVAGMRSEVSRLKAILEG